MTLASEQNNESLLATCQNKFQKDGFYVAKHLFSEQQLNTIEPVLRHFHEKWLQDNHDWYRERAINSAYITSPKYLDESQRLTLFKFIAQPTLTCLVDQICSPTMFMGTQLFFDPYNPNQANYWHRDVQYNGDLAYQQAALKGPQVLHIRVPLVDETGVELIPGTHARWDTELELDTRYENSGRKVSDDLPNTQRIALKKGDALIFSANMTHRGLYANAPESAEKNDSRFAFDILMCDGVPELKQYMQPEVMPSENMLRQVSVPRIFT